MKRYVLSLIVSALTLTAAPVWAQTLNLTNNLSLWFRADAGVTTNATGNVSVWGDQTAYGGFNDATNTTLANQPVWVGNAVNGKPAVRFDGISDELSTLSSVNLTNGLSIFLVAKNAVRKDYNGLFRIEPTVYGASSQLEVYWQAGTTDAGSGNPVYAVNRCCGNFGALQGFDAKPPVNNYYVYDTIASGMAGTQRVQGVTVAAASGIFVLPNSSAQAHLGIGYGGSGTGGLLIGDIAEVLVYDSPLSVSQRNEVEGYLADKYLISIPEPASFSYLVLSALAAFQMIRGRRRS